MRELMICTSYNMCQQQCGKHYKVHKKDDDCESCCGHFRNPDGSKVGSCISAVKFIRKEKLQKLNMV